MLGLTASLWETTLGQDIYEFGSTSSTSVSSMELTTTTGRGFPYLLLNHLLGRSLNMPSSQVVVDASPPSIVTKIIVDSITHTTPVEIS